MNPTHCVCGNSVTQQECGVCEKCKQQPMRRVLAYYGKKTPEEIDLYMDMVQDQQQRWGEEPCIYE